MPHGSRRACRRSANVSRNGSRADRGDEARGVPVRYRLLAKLLAPPVERRLEPALLHPLAELAADLGLRRIERDERVGARLERGAQARDLGTAIDPPLAPAQPLGRD